MLENKVFDRRETYAQIISDSLYNGLIGLTLIWGFFINWLMVKNVDPMIIMRVPLWIFLIGYFACCFGGIMIFTKSDEPIMSFLGYNLVVIPFGLIVNFSVHQYDPDLVLDALRVTGLVTGIMMMLGSMFPAFFKGISRALFFSLIIVLIVELVEVLVFRVHHGILDWVVVVIFCGYIGYDWSRAQAIPKTVDNAIDSAASLYMDIIVLFTRILSIMGRRR